MSRGRIVFNMAEADLTTLLSTLTVSRRPGRYCIVDIRDISPDAEPAAIIHEDGGTTAIVMFNEVLGTEPEFVAAWLTLDVHSDLAAVGLTAAVATCLAAEAIACNVLAGRVHDHLLVAERDAPRAIAALNDLALRHSQAERTTDQLDGQHPRDIG
ncbi:MAG: ACT domain-containing protein [Acidimicrobiales bacterium]